MKGWPWQASVALPLLATDLLRSCRRSPPTQRRMLAQLRAGLPDRTKHQRYVAALPWRVLDALRGLGDHFVLRCPAPGARSFAPPGAVWFCPGARSFAPPGVV